MKIYNPLKSYKETQGFGADKACVQVGRGGEVVKPLKITSKKLGECLIGYIPFYGWLGMKGHNGLDVKCPIGSKLYFPVDADCEWYSRSYVDDAGGLTLDVYSSKPVKLGNLPKEAGKMAKAQYGDRNGSVYIMFRFIHLSKILIDDAKRPSPDVPKPTPNVKKGDLIALTGNTGASSGPHLHWGFKITAENSMTIDNDNGYLGALDMQPWREDTFVNATPDTELSTLKKLRLTLMLQVVALLTRKVQILQEELDKKRNK